MKNITVLSTAMTQTFFVSQSIWKDITYEYMSEMLVFNNLSCDCKPWN